MTMQKIMVRFDGGGTAYAYWDGDGELKMGDRVVTPARMRPDEDPVTELPDTEVAEGWFLMLLVTTVWSTVTRLWRRMRAKPAIATVCELESDCSGSLDVLRERAG
jgi:hypothetical protein